MLNIGVNTEDCSQLLPDLFKDILMTQVTSIRHLMLAWDTVSMTAADSNTLVS